MSCKTEQEKVEEEVLQPVYQWVEQQEQRCREEECKWWMLCLNKLVCWLVTVLAKVTVWVLMVVVRWVYRVVCTVVKVVYGILAMFTLNFEPIEEAAGEVWELVKDVFYTATGFVIYYALRIVDIVQTAVGLQEKARKLTAAERRVLYPIFRDSLVYDLIRVVEGNAGLLGISGAPYTMGWTMYIPSTLYNGLLVHESVHIWQFQFEGTRYIGNSAFHQLDRKVFSPGYNPYVWRTRIDAGATWYTLGSAEAQAEFIEDVFLRGEFVPVDPEIPPDVGNGAFFREDAVAGMNQFIFEGVNYTAQANDAWLIVRTS